MARLETIIRNMLPLHKTPIKPKRKTISLIRCGILDSQLNSSNASIAMGIFYEVLSQAFYGGELGKHVGIDNGNGDSTSTRPDIINTKENIIYEVKSCRRGKEFFLQDRQMEFYKAMQVNFLSNNKKYPKIYFVIYVHPFEGVRSAWKGTRYEMYDALASETLYSLVVPFNLIVNLHDPNREIGDLVYTYNNKTKYNTGSKVRSSAIKGLFTEPERVIRLLGGYTSDYSIERLRVPRDIHVRIGKVKRIKQFPIVKIDYKDYDKWSETFSKEYLGDVPF
ncbi:hypothetical protein J4230_03965 [Candidatus Woesearchaeota archaeon]|nr:hypothetical protein [Candidatus Woesearchaeota archaeon]